MKIKNYIPQSVLSVISSKITVALISAASTFAISFFTWAFQPVKRVIHLPQRIDIIEEKIESLNNTYKNGIVVSSSTDSTLTFQVRVLGEILAETDKNVRVVQIQIDAIGEEFPSLHRRFDDIQKSVNSINSKLYEPKISSKQK